MKPNIWQNPILIEPRFDMEDPLRLMLQGEPPATLASCYRLPARFGSDLGAYLADENELVVCAGPLLYEPGKGESTALCELFKGLAAVLPDLRLVCHDESGVTGAFTEGLVTDITVRGGTVSIARRPIQEVVPRARYYDRNGSGQDFDTLIWLLLSLAAEPAAPKPLLEQCIAEVSADIAWLRRISNRAMADLWNTIPVQQQLHALSELGCELQALRTSFDEVEQKPIGLLLEWLQTVHRSDPGHNPEHISDVSVLEGAFGPNCELATILTTVGAGTFPGEIELWPLAKIANAVQSREHREPEPIAIGRCKGKALFLDTRFRPAPVLIECTETDLGLLEEEDSLYSLLLWHAP